MEESVAGESALITWIGNHFGLVQIGISVLFFAIWFRSRANENAKSRFKLREADRDLNFARGKAATDAANASTKKQEPLRLAGIVKDGAPHEVLGISALASELEIQKAYKEKMKRYHPDRIGRPGSREWTEATAIAEAINHARNAMMERLKNRTSR
jgi:DnaJ-domain-containing protein 1